MPFNYCRTKRPREALLDLYIDKKIIIVENRRERLRISGIPLLVIFESYLVCFMTNGDSVWLLVCLGQAPAKK